ncbi:LacI family DNA-binding transcriptional regulator [Massilia sp. TS11]|uniref:LacI family DNA-binding transcriptional regulator n=1 Tax=Massilia sp. TS11 TaxID=2908003 RepID=UPI001EDAB65B|nr:LacI family DNA-binding transcriptional regulator [Massilia sp. TS11]MCG2586734.1 LacI family DNA-binding transcriptional regulator [Massilia sp. TS11]
MSKSPSALQKVQMADIARLAGVATSTVSRALSNSPLVNEETRKRIQELARSLNYTVNLGAKNLRLGDNTMIGVVIPYLAGSRQHLTDPFFLAMLGSLADALTDRGYDMLLSRVEAHALDELAYLHSSGKVGGIIVIGQWGQHEQLNELARRRLNFVVWGAQLAQQAYCSIGSDNVEGGLLATEHLLARGRRRIAFMGDKALPEPERRHAGYLKALRKAGLKADPALYIPSGFNPREAQQALSEHLARHGQNFDAIFAASDLIAISAMGLLKERGLSVPGDVSVVGYDDIDAAAHSFPPLSTVRQPLDLAGAALVDSLLQLMQGRQPASQSLPTKLVERAST